MNKILVTVSTVTYAIKLRKLLLRDGIRSRLVKINSAEGCTHGVEISRTDFYRVVCIMKENNIEYKVENSVQL
ncbi:MAG: DUF3343 domain-containing protein [Clostridia bacterium]|nr:DUF3343 domain-containing protein [Clostridia bacterium]